MKKFINFFVLVHLYGAVFAQDTATLSLRNIGDSLLKVIEKQNDPYKRHNLILYLLGVGTDQDPIYTLVMARKLYEIGEKNNDKVALASAYSYYGQGYRLSGNYVKALDYHYRAIREGELSKNESLLAQVYNQLAHIYKDREDFTKAIELYQISREYADRGNMQVFWPYMNLGAVYLGNRQPDSSLYFSRLAYNRILAADSLISKQFLPYILGNIGAAYSFMKKEPEALNAFRNALAIINSPTYKSLRQKQLLYTRIANHFKEIGKLDSCIYYAKLAITSVENTMFSYLNTKPARMLSELYEIQQADSSIKYLKLFLKTNEVINSTRVTQQLQMKAFEEKQRSLEVEQARKEYRSRIQIYVLSGGIITLLLFAGLLFRNNKQKQRSNQLLQQQKLELQTTLDKLSATQSQLIQSEKMASLGELTAGIAHEIQNPLNFVNNFSEVNKELLVEMKDEMDKGNIADAQEIANDVISNEEKINHHGKRADAIVKGMLAHSRTSSGKKELTDLNALAEEYLRLSYHGLKAKDASFSATFHFEPDKNLPKVNVVPQDIGRVLLNLVNNAFYAVQERVKGETADVRSETADVRGAPSHVSPFTSHYQPQVTVTTKNLGGKVEILVQDNGNGIPESIRDKIFQPFFTTKPTGEGTGLGLSLSYDIVKAHGGEIKVETKAGEGSIFIIHLPVI